ncbi:MAG TPA: 16S rRNA (cytosine(1402)-N(4))-methyltransferase RsmH [Thermoanaerobaculia bacterium]|nr:16S rRNA (cytosine(1402)-N(4))-methyltransferase RsmH [Thermoanaerobaculia bacterium]
MDHVPVLVEEVLRYLAPERGGLYVDTTVGLGGHAEALLEASESARVLGIDRDPRALERAGRRLARFGGRVRLVEGSFSEIRELLARAEPAVARPAGILADLGVSSLQLDTPERGFSFRFDAPLDMRMGSSGPTAGEIVNRYPEADLTRIFREYGEERQARRIARALATARTEAPIETTRRLREVILGAKGLEPAGARREGRVDPATRVFQALRIEVNRELAELERFVDEAARLLAIDGRVVVISYHSLEDRIVKHSLRDLARGEIDEVTGRPRAESRILEVLTKKPVRPSPAEIAANPRARSARLRAAVRRGTGRTVEP